MEKSDPQPLLQPHEPSRVGHGGLALEVLSPRQRYLWLMRQLYAELNEPVPRCRSSQTSPEYVLPPSFGIPLLV